MNSNIDNVFFGARCSHLYQKRCLFLFFATTLFFPSINFNLISSEVFPWGVLFSCIFLRSLSFKQVSVLFVFPLSALIFSLYNQSVPFEVFSSIFAYYNILLVVFTILKLDRYYYSILKVLFRRILLFLIFLGVLQYFGVLSSLQFLWDLLLTRGSSSIYEGGRGVALLSSEPSRAGVEIVFIFIGFWLSIESKCTLLLRYFYLFLFSVFIVFFIKSVLALFVLFLFVFLHLIHLLKRPFILTSFILFNSTIFVFLFLFGNVDVSSVRSLNVIFNLFGQANLMAAYEYLMSQSGFRFISAISPYYIVDDFIFGGGVGFWKSTSVIALESSGLNPARLSYFIENCNSTFCSVKPSSFVSSLVLDLGLVTSVIICIFLFKKFILPKNSFNYNSYLVFFFLYLLIFSEVGNPLPWMVTSFLFLNEIYSNKNYLN